MDEAYEELLFLMSLTSQRRTYSYRPKYNPVLALPDIQFRREFRMTKSSFKKLYITVSPMFSGAETDPETEQEEESGRQMAKYKKLLVALKFYAAGNFHYDTGSIESYSASQVCLVVKEVSAVIASLFHEYVKFPDDANRRRVRNNIPLC